MSKFNIGDKVFFIQINRYLEKAEPCCDDAQGNVFSKTKIPFTVTAICDIQRKGVDEEIVKSVEYELVSAPNDYDGRAYTYKEINENYLFADWDECCKKAKELTESTKWESTE